ncbi:MAG: heparinase II/III family protein, partial [Pseudomonadota bacterium]|nr:heparinase II/III family protein [Pseudomonadota bacterium]
LALLATSSMLAFAACTANGPNSEIGGQAAAESAPTVSAPLFEKTMAHLKREIDARMENEVPVPVPADAGGGYTHEQHKLNGTIIYNAGMLYRATGDEAYRDFATRILLDYADLYPTLDLHPQVRIQTPSRLFWQGLNEAVWLVYVSQGYDAIRDDISAQKRNRIDTQLIRPMADFLSDGSPQTFDRIHNHGTWAAAAVGMTGYTLNDADMVEKALYGLDRSGDAGFLRQIEQLFSPDGYYAEGPYYQRYALMPFVLFAEAIEKNDPEREIFEYRDGVLLKAITSTVQLSYAGKFFPINDAIREKGLTTTELRYALAIAYNLTGDPTLLSVIEQQGRVVPTPAGRKAAQAIAAGKAEPFPFRTMLLRDGAQGNRGALTILRSGPGADDAAIVFKATSQGLGHGHFDRLGLLYYDGGGEVVADYGAARFLNVEPKNGGRYLPENESWAKQTIAHNTLVVDRKSQFDADWKRGEEYAPRIVAFSDETGASYAAAEIDTAYPGTSLERLVALVKSEEGRRFVIDIFRATSDEPHTFDLPVHFKGQLIETSFPFEYATEALAPLGESAGYQHLWKTAEAAPVPAGSQQSLSVLIGEQFYTMSFASDLPMTAALARLGANDPNNNLRNEQALIVQSEGKAASFFSVFEPHGIYDSTNEVTVYGGGSVKSMTQFEVDGVDVYAFSTETGETHQALFAKDLDPARSHSISIDGGDVSWTGPVHLLRTPDAGAVVSATTNKPAGEDQ